MKKIKVLTLSIIVILFSMQLTTAKNIVTDSFEIKLVPQIPMELSDIYAKDVTNDGLYFSYDNAYVFTDYKGNTYKVETTDMYRDKNDIITPDYRNLSGFDTVNTFLENSYEYHELCLFHSGKAIVRYNGLYGYIDDEYNWLIPPIYDVIYPFSEGYAIAVKDKTWYVLDEQGNVKYTFTREWVSISDFNNGYALLNYYPDNIPVSELTGSKAILLNSNFERTELEGSQYYIYQYGTLIGINVDDDALRSIVIYNLNGEVIYTKEFDDCKYKKDLRIGILKNGVVRIRDIFMVEYEYISPTGELMENSGYPKIYYDTEDTVLSSERNTSTAVMLLGSFDEYQNQGWYYAIFENKMKVYTLDKSQLNLDPKPIDKSKIKPYITPDPSGEICVYLNGNKLEFDSAPYMKSDRTMVPMRAIFEALGANVDWDNGTQTAAAVRDGDKISITIGEDKLYKNGEAIELDASAELINDSRTFVPLRAVSEAFGCEVNWNEEANSVEIKNK